MRKVIFYPLLLDYTIIFPKWSSMSLREGLAPVTPRIYWMVTDELRTSLLKLKRFLMREMRKTWLATLRALAIYFIDSISTILENFNTLKNFVGMKIK